MDDFFIGMAENSSDDDWTENIIINNKAIEVKLDTGAQCNVMSLNVYNSIVQNNIAQNNIFPIVASNARLIIDEDAPSLLGRKTCLELGLIERIMNLDRSDGDNESGDDILNHYPDLFSGLGCIQSVGKHHIEVDPNIKPVIHPPRKVPAALRHRIKELERMVDLGLIETQSEPTSWVNSMVTVAKPNKLRVCIDPRDLNRAIRREHYPLPTVEEAVSRLPKALVFSALDASSGLWQIELDDSSSTLCTFNTPFGRYRFKRLPFGISSAPEVFQKVMTTLLEGLDELNASQMTFSYGGRISANITNA
ncbi:uncharacterized protein K02A2.6-like [Dendronephthya gigantea]|uniref:uncharacterized protein K02A2.6-like n=1 Tax=Dendronephthya gigantea TaxID=151771 RepID=UPI00106AEBC5|nr:uncharacterized protein K02A2.6-like [Dendronephthya gigantea]